MSVFDSLVIQIDINYENKKKIETKLEQIHLRSELLRKDIQNAKKNLIEKIIEYILFGLVSYSHKYDDIIKEHEESIRKLNLNRFERELEWTNTSILNLEKEFNHILNIYKEQLLDFQTKLLNISNNRYINNYQKEELENELCEIIYNKEKFCFHKDIKSSISEVLMFKENSTRWIEKNNIFFIQNEKVKENFFFDTIESNPLTDKQQEAVLVNENNNLVLAGAGSGKTSVIIAKVAYLIQQQILHPREILVLAFNKNAQQELEERFTKQNIKVTVKTFHSFGLSVIAESLSQKLMICPMTESEGNMTKFIKNTIKNLMSSSNGFLENFITFMAYFRIPYKSESDFNSLGEYYDYQKNYDMKTLKHEVVSKGIRQEVEALMTLQEETVKSHQEVVIANFLTLNGIKYLYEEPYEHKTYTVEKTQYQPDFFLPEYGIYIEHFGIDRKNKTAPYIDNKEYLEGIKWKVSLHEKYNTPLIQTFSYEFNENNLLDLLKEKLLKKNVIFRELEFAEISELLKEPIEKNEFTKLFTTFLKHYKSNMHTIEGLKNKASQDSEKSERTGLFLKLFEFIFIEYEKYQKRNHCIDFDDMIVKALDSIEDGKYEHGFKHIFIDEFQDISTTRAKLIKKLLPINNTSITAVGDDWQSINRFAGSNIQIIQDFKETFGVSKTVVLDYTFRFNNIVSEVSSSFVQKNPHQIKKEIKTIKNQDLNKFSILLYWTTGDEKVDLKQILNLIYKKEKNNKKSIMVLARYKFLFKDLKELNINYPTLDIKFSTVHGSKGNEADYVIILNIDNGKFGFPSKVVDDPILDLVVPAGDDYEDAEERRLFYVALTRTKGTIFLLSDMYNKSTFIKELIEENKDDIFFLNDPQIKLQNCPTCKTGFLKKRVTSKNKNNHFYGCSNFPRCKFTENVNYCPECTSEVFKNIKERVSKCSNKDCSFKSSLCIKCNGQMIERKGQYGIFLGCANYPKCTYSEKTLKGI